MTPKQPPRTATWMLKHFGSGASGHQTGIVLLFAGSIVLMQALLFGQFLLDVRPPAAWIYTFLGRRGGYAAYVVASVLGILLGGGLFRDHSRTAIRDCKNKLTNLRSL